MKQFLFLTKFPLKYPMCLECQSFSKTQNILKLTYVTAYRNIYIYLFIYLLIYLFEVPEC